MHDVVRQVRLIIHSDWISAKLSLIYLFYSYLNTFDLSDIIIGVGFQHMSQGYSIAAQTMKNRLLKTCKGKVAYKPSHQKNYL